MHIIEPDRYRFPTFQMTRSRNADDQTNVSISPPAQSTTNPSTPTTAPQIIPDTPAALGAAALATTLVALAAAELAAPTALVPDADTADTTPDVLDAPADVAPEVAAAEVILAVDDGLATLLEDAVALVLPTAEVDVEAATAPPAAPSFSNPAVIVRGK